MKSLIFILTVIINVQAESHIFHKRNVDLRTEIYGMKTNAILFHTNLHCVFFIHFMPSIIFNIVPTLILYEKLNHRNIGLTNYWPIENSQAMDVVGAKDLYEPINCLFSNDRFGTNASALSFNNGFMKAPSGDYLGGNEFTVLAWVKLREYLTWQRLLDFSNGGFKNNIYVSLSNSQKMIRFMIANNNVESEYDVISSVLTLNIWYHLGITLNQGLMSIYVDGNLKNSKLTENLSLSTVDYKEYCFIGKSVFGHDPNGNFECDDIKFFNKALTDAEIDKLPTRINLMD
ncbi:glycoside hydrolase [Brachionus plicatilis]|uniref:Glycoside hydrolase n=1 Tax=Brachionus plicatilis TaxID=10195 RepID=A0A3M7Q9V7_BRAPC|nr:glycoside hydrolase [Brachionus plicatilis]